MQLQQAEPGSDRKHATCWCTHLSAQRGFTNHLWHGVASVSQEDVMAYYKINVSPAQVTADRLQQTANSSPEERGTLVERFPGRPAKKNTMVDGCSGREEGARPCTSKHAAEKLMAIPDHEPLHLKMTLLVQTPGIRVIFPAVPAADHNTTSPACASSARPPQDKSRSPIGKSIFRVDSGRR